MSDKDQSRRRTPSRLRQIRLCESAPNLKAFFSITQNHNNSVMMPPNEKINYNNMDKLRRGNSLRIPFLEAEEKREIPLRRGGSLNFKRTSQNHRIINQHHHVSASDVFNNVHNPSCCNLNNNNETNYETSSNTNIHAATHSAPVSSALAPEYLAISLLQLGCPLISMPRREVKMRVCVSSTKFYEIYERAWCMLCEEQLEGGIENLPIIVESTNK
ncbi:hypothetical protein PV326_002563 [Microctonus aethiopoides]|nr:hypothetical protein PV326_002563 [Microctonus aethiopoides]